MSENPRSTITITLGDSRQVVKRAGPPLGGSFGDSQSLVGRKRSVKDRLSGVGDPTPEFNKKRLRANGRGFFQADSADDMGLKSNDLRFKIMRKNTRKISQSNSQQSVLDLRDLLSRPAQSSNASAAASPNIPELSDARQRFPELGNGKKHMYDMREPKRNIPESRHRRNDISKVTDVRPRMQEPNSSGAMGHGPSTYVAGSLSRTGMLRSPSSAWTSERLRRSSDVALRHRPPDVGSRQRSPDVSLRRGSPDVGFRQRSPNVGFRQRSPGVALRQRSPDIASRRRSPDVASDRRSPNVSLRQRSPNVFLRRRSPDAALGLRSPNVALRRRSPDVALRRRSPDVALRRRSPDVAWRRSLEIALKRRSPNEVLRHRFPDVSVRRRSPDVSLSTAREYSPPRREDLQRGPPVRPYNDGGAGKYMSKDVHDFSRSRTSVPYMATAALPAAHAHTSKNDHDFSRPRPSVPYMTTAALPAVHARPMIPVPIPSMLPINIVQRSSYTIDDPPTVDSFLRSLGLEKYSINFKAEEVDLYSLRQMGDKDLKDLGIPMGPRKKILLALQSRYKILVS